MAERYSRLFALPQDLYTNGSPVVISAGVLLKDNQKDRVIAQLKIRSISDKTIKAVKVCITPLDIAGDVLGDTVQHQYLDLNINREEEFGPKNAIQLPNAAVRAFRISVTDVIFTNDARWIPTNAVWEALQKPESSASIADPELVKQFEIEYQALCKKLPLFQKDLWHCSCGALNHEEEDCCYLCGCSRTALQNLDWQELAQKKEVRCEEERVRAEQLAEEERIQAIVTKKKIKKTAMIIAVFAVILTALGVWLKIIRPNMIYNEAVELFNNGDKNAAFQKLLKISEDEEACALAMDIKCTEAILLEREGNEDAAIKVLKELDVPEISPSARYDKAFALNKKGEYFCAHQLLYDVSDDYNEANQHLSAFWRDVVEAREEEQKREKYASAIKLMNEGKNKEASALFAELDDYKDSEKFLIQLNPWKIKISTEVDGVNTNTISAPTREGKVLYVTVDIVDGPPNITERMRIEATFTRASGAKAIGEIPKDWNTYVDLIAGKGYYFDIVHKSYMHDGTWDICFYNGKDLLGSTKVYCK